MGFKLIKDTDGNEVVELKSNTLISAYEEALDLFDYRLVYDTDHKKNLKPCWVEICMDIESIGETGQKVELDISPYLGFIDTDTLLGVVLHDNFNGGEWTDNLARTLESFGENEVTDFMGMIGNANRFGGDLAVGFVLRVNSKKELVEHLLENQVQDLEDVEYEELKILLENQVQDLEE